MTLDQFSVLVTLALFALTLAVAAVGIAALAPATRARVLALGYDRFMLGTLGVSLAAIVGAMLYQIVYLTPVCNLCWWQRIFLFPPAAIAFVSLWKGDRTAPWSIGILSALGLAVAAYHYYAHFQVYVLGRTLSLPCGGGVAAACADSPILTFGFVTIPFMGILTFGVLLALCALAAAAGRAPGKGV